MLLHIAILIFVILCEASSDFISESTWRDMKNVTIDNIEEYCKNKNCIVKCCPDGHVITGKPLSCYPQRIDYSNFNKYISWDDSLSKTNVSYFHFIQNDQLFDLKKKMKPGIWKSEYQLLKDGSMKYVSQILIPKFRFCVDFVAIKGTPKLAFKIAPDPEKKDGEAKSLFIVIGMLISSFFMCLVLLVYALLPNLQNILGKVLMAYLFSMTGGFILRAAETLANLYPSNISFSCSDTSPASYFFILSSFFWLNVMSFDLWWTLRGQRKCREIHRQGERVKFFYYCTYAWGTPLLVTLLVVIVDKLELYSDIKYVPPFKGCYAEDFSTRLYMHLPIGIITILNIVFFSMTVYNIWLIKRSVITNNESRNTKRQQNRFAIYIKLFVLMGVGWIFELVSSEDWVWHILLSIMPLFSGVFIFYMFVCKKNIILMLCKRLNIQNRFVDRLRPPNYSYAESSNCSRVKSRHSQKSSVRSTEVTTLSTER